MDYDALIFSGGGIRGIAYGGVVEALDELNLLSKVKKFAGVSAGAIAAGLIAVGYNGKDVKDILLKIDFEQFKDNSYFHTMDLYNLINYYGIYSGDKILEFYGKLLEDKTGNKDITFKQLYDEYGVTLVIVVSCLNKEKPYYYNYNDNPDLPIRIAVRRSMSVPFIFNAECVGTDILVDGGLLDNFPIWIFDSNNFKDDVDDPQIIKNSKSLGFKLVNEKISKDYTLVDVDKPVTNIMEFSSQLIESMMVQIERGHINNEYFDKTVFINTLGTKSFNFNISTEQKEKLIKSGYDTTKKFIEKKLKEINNGKTNNHRKQKKGRRRRRRN